MADTTTSTLDAAVTAAYQRQTYFALRPLLQHDQFATVQPTRQTHPGSSVQFTFMTDLAQATTALTEGTEVTPVALTDSTVSVSLTEYGNVVNRTLKLVGLGFLNYDADIANVVGYNGGDSQDQLAADVLYAGTNVLYSGGAGARASLTTGDEITAHDVRTGVATLRANSAMGWDGMTYAGCIHPDVSLDLREETGTAAWSDPVAYSDATRRWNGEIGKFEGVRWVETPRALLVADGGATTFDAYGTIICGQECLAKAFSTVTGPTAQFRAGPITDNLMREKPAGWYWLGGYARFREASLYRIESISSIGANA